ncbi:MAG: DMT family transporter, partial [Lactobacillaceae bacterium]|nr:DMT family transporter [Lactobacillaceae bacterium]
IDQFGWFGSDTKNLSLAQFFGLLLVIIGMLLATGMISKQEELELEEETPSKLPWQILGIIAGMATSAQATINGHLGIVLHSSIHAAAVSFTLGAIVLILIVLFTRVPLKNIAAATHAGLQYWWIWLGGLLGAFYVFGSAWLAPIIGTGQLVILALFGQLALSVFIDQFGLLESIKKKITTPRLFGLLVMFVGVVILRVL